MKAKYVKEFFKFPDIMVMGVLCLASAGVTLYNSSHAGLWIAIIIGFVVFVASEYLTHRFLFHLKPPKSTFFLNLLKRLHYDHHANPNNLHLLFLPLWYSVSNFTFVGAIFFAITGDFVLTNAFITGIMLLYLYYEWTHYVAHRPIQPITAWGKWMKKVHIWHHYNNEHFWFGVTNPSFDYMLGTFKDRDEVEKSPTARDLEKRGNDLPF